MLYGHNVDYLQRLRTKPFFLFTKYNFYQNLIIEQFKINRSIQTNISNLLIIKDG